MEKFSYTEKVAFSPDLLASRHWEFVPREKSDVEVEKTPQDMAAETMEKLFQLDEKTKKQLAVGIVSSGTEAVKHSILERMSTTKELKIEISHELSKQGWEKFCESITTALQREKEVEDTDTSVGNISRTKGSATAEGTALLRYLAHQLGFGPDHLAHLFCNEDQKRSFASVRPVFEETGVMLSTDPGGEKRKSEPWNVSLCNVTYLHNRTCFGDDVLRRFVQQDFPDASNLILLGAGFDTRFYRLSLPASAHLFEVDTYPSSKAKQESLKACSALLEKVNRVQFVSCDFQTQSWFDVLVGSAELDTKLPSVIILEGVTQYIPQPIFESTLEIITGKFRGPCGIVFDYFAPQLISHYAQAMKHYGEPHVFGLEPDDMEKLIVEKGLEVLDHLSLEDCSRRYMPYWKDSGTPLGLGTEHKCFLMAANPIFAETVRNNEKT